MAHAMTMKSAADFKFVRMHATEELGKLYEFRVDAITQDKNIKLKDVLGTPLGVTVKVPESGYQRHYHGIVSEIELVGFRVIRDVRWAMYQLVVVPKPWVLTRMSNLRIFKNRTVPQIVREEILRKRAGFSDVELALNGSYKPREYCVQYRETDFDFISRLMQEEGIYYYFKHAAGKHTMVLADGYSSHRPEPGFASIPYTPPGVRGSRTKASILEWKASRNIETTRVRLVDYDYLRPKTKLDVEEKHPDPASSVLNELESYDYAAGRYEDPGRGRDLAEARVRASSNDQISYAGLTDACGLMVGSLFSMTEFGQGEIRKDDAKDVGFNQQYLVVSAQTRLEEPMYASVSELDEDREPFQSRFTAVDKKAPYVVQQTTAQPRIAGYQTGVVYGKTDEDIDVDQYGRVEVQFHWSKSQPDPESYSRRVRVASSWAGSGWGAVHIPRVGQEVVMCFLDGNPDQPLIIGSVYNGANKQPWPLPAEKTKSGVRSRSLRGGRADYNEIMFEDKKGQEELLIHAQRDWLHEAERDEKGQTGRDRSQDVKRDDTLDVGRDLQITARHRIQLKVGMNTLTLDNRGISLNGMKIELDAKTALKANAGIKMTLKAKMKLSAESRSLLKISSSMTMLEAKTLLSLEGLPVVSVPPPVPVVPPPIKIAVKLLDQTTDMLP